MDVYDDVVSTPSGCMRFLSCVWKIISCIFTHFILVTMVVSYCLLGALMFEHLEKDYEKFIKQNITYMRNNVSEDLWSFTVSEDVLVQKNWTDNAMERIKHFESDLIVAIRRDGWDGIEDQNVVQWTFTGSLFFSIIVITTIGYGHIAPKTQMGKVATILYAIVGIPMMLLCLSNIGDMMANSFRFLYWRVCCFACTRSSSKRRNSAQRRSRSVRSSHRSRTASLRGGRPSQRSVDSAIYLPEIQQPYFDTGVDQSNSRFAYGSKDDNRVVRGKSVHRMDSTSQSNASAGGPVLCNIYALDPDEAFRAKQVRSSTLPPRGIGDREEPDRRSGRSLKENRNTLSVDAAMAPHKLRSTPDLSGKQEAYARNPSPSIMSPMGFIVQRSRGGADSYPSSYSDFEESVGGPVSTTKPVPIWLCVLLVVSYIIGGAFLFSGWEKWDFSDSAYFCFITLTTIGFGDFVPAQRAETQTDTQIRIGLCSLYLLFGIALLAMSFNLVQEEVINNVKAVARHLGIIKDESQDDTDEE